MTTLGKRFAIWADERCSSPTTGSPTSSKRYPLRGIKGPVGTAQDMLDLLDGDAAALATLERLGSPTHLGFARVLRQCSAGVSTLTSTTTSSTTLVQVASAPSNAATTIRLMAGSELVTEGFKPGQVGSSAMPHKMKLTILRAHQCLAVILRGYASMIG